MGFVTVVFIESQAKRLIGTSMRGYMCVAADIDICLHVCTCAHITGKFIMNIVKHITHRY